MKTQSYEVDALSIEIGYQVEVINFGHPYWVGGKQLDASPDLVGKRGIVVDKTEVQGSFQYTVSGIARKYAWYYQEQLKLLYRPKYL